MTAESQNVSTFRSIFFEGDHAVHLSIPNYQRAFSWEEKQIEFFIGDLERHSISRLPYYYGHFIVENRKEAWEIVDGQQRITTFVIFLAVCRYLSPYGPHAPAYSLIEKFRPVSYDAPALDVIIGRFGSYLESGGKFDSKHPPSSEEVREGFGLENKPSRSQKRIVLAILQFHQAFRKGRLDSAKIGDLIDVVMGSLCSLHLTDDKSVAVSVFEMHNTRGVPLTILEVVKAMLMKFVYDHAPGNEKENCVKEIQDEFGQIYRMEEQLAASSFRGEMTMDQLLRLHLRAVDDGGMQEPDEFRSPAADANADGLLSYIRRRLHFLDRDEKVPSASEDGVRYAQNLARELRESVRIVSEQLPEWDRRDPLVGDVMILERGLSCEFFLVVCRRLDHSSPRMDAPLTSKTLAMWEKLLFTRDFHAAYYRLWYKDDFPMFFAQCGNSEAEVVKRLEYLLVNGFRANKTSGLQTLVANFLRENEVNLLTNAFYWWKPKMIYALYKYEVSQGANIREVMKGTISVEHILPQEWQWEWTDEFRQQGTLSADQKEFLQRNVGAFINGLGNLLLLTPGDNTAVGNKHPAMKNYRCEGGSYREHDENRERWNSSSEWPKLIEERGRKILEFILRDLVAKPEEANEPSPVLTQQ